MAIKPETETEFVGKINASNADYPQGSARDITTPGDATGTPWTAVLLNDIWGFLQKLLTIGGITPSGDPDTVLLSDYFDGLMTVVTRPTLTVATMTAIVGVKAGQVFNVAERSTGNGGGGVWVAVVTGTTEGVDEPNTFNIVVGVANNLISFVLREEYKVFSNQYGEMSGDITALLQQFALSTTPNKVISSGDIEIVSTVSFLAGEYSIEFESPVNITANGTYTGSVVINIGSTTRTLIGTTATQLDAGNRTIAFDGLLKDDIIAIWNPVDSSYSGFNVVYRQGEFCKVSDDSSGGTTEFDDLFIDTYPSGTKIFRLTTKQTAKKIFGEINFTSTVNELRICLAINQGSSTDISDLHMTAFESTHLLHLLRCYRTEGVSVSCKQTGTSVSGRDYGLAISNCQYADIEGYFSAERHGVTTGGDGTNAAIVNRFINVRGTINTTGQGSVQAADWHGNTEFSSYGGKLQGLSLAGHDNYVLDGTLIDPVPEVVGATVSCAEMKSMKFDLSNIIVRNYGDPDTVGSRGVIDIGGNTLPVQIFTTIPGRFNLSNSKIIAPIANLGLRLRNRGSLVDHSVDISGLEIDMPLATAPISIATISGNDIEFLYKEGYHDPDNGSINVDPTTVVTGNEILVGQHNFSVTTSINLLTVAVVFNKVFIIGPEVIATPSIIYAGSIAPIARVTSLNNTGFDLTIATPDASNFSNNEVIKVRWIAIS